MNDKTFDIIEITADNKQYYPKSLGKQSWMEDQWVAHTEMDIPLGQSRYGGCVIDLPKGVEIPSDMRFAGQLDLAEVSKCDTQNRLPKTGQLIFFAAIENGVGKVIYKNVNNNDLERVIVEHEDNFFSGVLISGFKSNQEKLSDYYKVPEEDLECWECGENIIKCSCQFEGKQEHIESLDFLGLNDEGKNWDDFEGYDKSKLFGVYTHCQTNAEERIEIMETEIVLLQIGENGFNDEGVFNILIKEEDLKNKNFDNCTVEWAQS